MIQILWARSIRIYGNQANCWLAGGRSCSVFAECREVQKDDQPSPMAIPVTRTRCVANLGGFAEPDANSVIARLRISLCNSGTTVPTIPQESTCTRCCVPQLKW